ncbi:MAG: hypothetical protein PHY31_08220, partial [Smithellaceae bacterium]|nr:hypothetical protein [Smithellaceae bacterium]
MYDLFEERVKEILDLSAKPSSDSKVMSVHDAVERFIRPGMHFHIGHAYLRPNAAVYEICRQFWGKNPAFTISSLGFISNMVLFVYGNLAKKLITT